jgi:hypothetical protein
MRGCPRCGVLFNSNLEGNVRRAIDIHEGDTIDEKPLKALIRAAVALNISVRAAARRPRPRRCNNLSFPPVQKIRQANYHE